jgi:multiple sugar transport system permease protein
MAANATAVKPRRFRLPNRLVLQQWLEGYFFASPFIIGFLVFIAFPMIYSIWLSFHSWDLLSPPRFVGLANFTKMLKDPIANLSLYNSAFYTFIAVPIQLVISFTLAVALTQKLRARDLYRAGFYMPIIIPIVAGAVVWQRVFHYEYGIFNEVLRWVGLGPYKWLFDPALAKPAFIIMSFWSIGRMMVIFIAGLGNIPQSMYEAASIDGAGSLKRMRHITVPLMSPLIFYNMVIAIIASFQTFVPAKIMTDGGPENATLFVVLNIWRQGFQFFNMGYASALAWQLFIVVVGFTIAQFYMSNRWVYYEQ